MESKIREVQGQRVSKGREVQRQIVNFKLELEEGDSLVRKKKIQVEKKMEKGNKCSGTERRKEAMPRNS